MACLVIKLEYYGCYVAIFFVAKEKCSMLTEGQQVEMCYVVVNQPNYALKNTMGSDMNLCSGSARLNP